jgi:hypothetical protein
VSNLTTLSKKEKNLCPLHYDKMLEGLLLVSFCVGLCLQTNVSVVKAIINTKGAST